MATKKPSLTQQVDDMLRQLNNKAGSPVSSIEASSILPDSTAAVSDTVSASVAASVAPAVVAAVDSASSSNGTALKVCAIVLTSLIVLLIIFVCLRRYLETNERVRTIFGKLKKCNDKQDASPGSELDSNGLAEDPNFTRIDWDALFSTSE